jgi:CSLREA domain-containing protein
MCVPSHLGSDREFAYTLAQLVRTNPRGSVGGRFPRGRVRGTSLGARLALCALLAATQARAASIVVDSLADGTPANDGSCTLREAIINANADAQSGSTDCVAGSGADAVTFGATGPIVLGSTLPNVTGDLTITGPDVTISGANTYRIFVVDPGVTLSLNDLTIVNGLSASGDGGAIFSDGTLDVSACTFQNNHTAAPYSGGAIVTYGPLTVTDSVFTNNSAGNGGAIYPRFAPATTVVSGSTFQGNVAMNATDGWGGAILLWDGAQVTVSQTTFGANVARLAGGAIYVQGTGSVLTIGDSQFDGNFVQDALSTGGAIASEGTVSVTNGTFSLNHAVANGGAVVAQGTTTLAGSSFQHNWAAYGGAIWSNSSSLGVSDSTLDHNGYDDGDILGALDGGGLYVAGNTTYVDRSTFVDNAAASGGALFNSGVTILTNVTLSGNTAHAGGAVGLNAGTVQADNATIVGNSADSGAGGIEVPIGTVLLRNTILADNGPQGNCSKVITNDTFSLSSDATCGFGVGYDDVAVGLAPLGDYGGPTLTYLPLAGSPAIDAGTGIG